MRGNRREGGVWASLAHWPLLLGAVVTIVTAATLIRDVPNGNLATAFLLIAVGMVTIGAFLAVYIFELARPPEEPSQEQRDDEAMRKLFLEQRRHIYRLSIMMIDAGLDPPQPPAPTFDSNEYPADRDSDE